MKPLMIFISLCLLTSCLSDPPEPPIQKHALSEERLYAAALSADATLSLTVEPDRICLKKNADNSLAFPCLKNPGGSMTELAGISENNHLFYVSNRIDVHLFSLKTGAHVGEWSSGQNIINDIALSKDGSVLLAGFRTGEAAVVQLSKGKISQFKIHELDINSIAVSASGKTAISGSSDKTATIWDTETGKVHHSFKHRSRVNHVDISSSGKLGLSLDAINNRFIWNLGNGEKQAELDTNLKFLEFNDSAFSVMEDRIVTGSPNQKIQLWQTSNGSLLKQWASHRQDGRDRASVLAVAITDDKISTITNDGILEVFKQ